MPQAGGGAKRLQTYRASGRGDLLRTLLVATPLAAVGAVLAGWVYQRKFIPAFGGSGSVWIGALNLIMVGFVVVTAVVAPIRWAARRFRCRNGLLVFCVGAIAGVVMYGTSWYVAVREAQRKGIHWTESDEELPPGLEKALETARQLSRNDPSLPAIAPEKRRTRTVQIRSFEDYVRFRRKQGWPEYGKSFSGAFVDAAWYVELALMTLVLGFFSRTRVMSLPYCEQHDRWTEGLARFEAVGVEPRAFRKAAKRRDVEGIVSFSPDSRFSGRARFTLAKCPLCEHGYLTVELGRRLLFSTHWDLDHVLENVRIGEPLIERVMARAEEFGAAEPTGEFSTF